MALSATEVNNLKKAPPVEGVLPVMLNRWSVRSFADREVSPATLTKIFEAARWAPSAHNEQPWRFLVGTRGSLIHKKIYDTLIGLNRDWAGAAPVLILGVASTKFTHNDHVNAYALYDLGAFASCIALQAAAFGLSTHQMAGYDHEAARQSLEISESFVLGAIIALGYQGDPAALSSEQLIDREIKPRTRKPLNEIVFSTWDTPVDLG